MDEFIHDPYLSIISKKIEMIFHLYPIYHQSIIHSYYAGWSVTDRCYTDPVEMPTLNESRALLYVEMPA